MDLRSEESRNALPWKPPDVTTIAVRHEDFEHAESEPFRQQGPVRRLQGLPALSRHTVAPATKCSMEAFTAHQLRHFCRVGSLDDAFFGHDHIDEVGRRHVEYRIQHVHIGAQPLTT